MKRLISLALCFLMMINIFPVKAFAEEEQSLEEIIRPQVEAFAKSIDQKNADGGAQDLLIGHGLGGNGKKLSVGKNSALTATLVNSELGKEFLTILCKELIRFGNEFEMDKVYSLGLVSWGMSEGKKYNYYIYDYNASESFKNGHYAVPEDELRYFETKINSLNFNSYDKKLELIAGGVHSDTDMKIKERNENNIVYVFDVRFFDRFDFDTDNGSALENLLGFWGMLLFDPFEWEAKCDFQIEIPIEKPEENEVFGDFDGSGNVDVSDAYFARLVAAKLIKPTPEQFALCDVDRDGRITAIDANLIRKYAAGIIGKLPVT